MNIFLGDNVSGMGGLIEVFIFQLLQPYFYQEVDISGKLSLSLALSHLQLLEDLE